MEATPLVLPLPLHPRRAQQLFQEVLLTDAELLSEQSLPQRLQQLQRLNLSGIQEAKRGARFQRIQAAADSSPHNEGEQVTLKLSKDGSTLQMLSDADGTVTASLQLVDVQGITLHATPIHSFSLKLSQHDDEPDNNATTVGATNTLVASSEGDLNRWVLALTCGVNAFQRQRERQCTEPFSPDAKAADLVWQAARLRIFELAEVMPLPEAIDHVTKSVPTRDFQQCEALRCRLKFLQFDAV
ncbi:hypothetical protein PR003_g14411 [Phytophthora rubi]|uniref:PH domain-containing protein n=1 Tax=Phytophthora rubi TaxID=129364 RepID=A0A6A4F540_9STRA|nr:hypothetical protein PR001_g13638 [Phytophthora rubi]KAE9332625.1 hypothetical protein PR003_g14411 [Phytophthora rubi]